MSFIIKKFLRKMIEQYLNIYDQISLEKGQLQLPSGHLNQMNINKILKAKGVPAMIVYSQYTNLGLSLPIIEILSKPIVLKMESLRVVILVQSELLNNIESKKQQKKSEISQPKSQQKAEKIEDKSQLIKQEKDKSTKSQKSYLKSIVNRLLTNMELQIKRLQIIIRYANRPASGQEAFQEIDEHQYKITLENLVAKNSLSLLQANILKKIICMSKFSITVHKISKQEQTYEKNIGEKKINEESRQKITKIAEILDLNMSLNIDYTRVTMICLLDKLRIGLETKLISWILHKLEETKKQTEAKTKNKTKTKQGHRKKEKKKQQNLIKPKLQGVQIKVNQIVFNLFNNDSQHYLEEKRNIDLFTFCILGLEVQKEKTKGYKERVTQSGQLEESQEINQSQVTINLQNISMLCRNRNKSKRNNSEMVQFVDIKMCEKNKKLVNSTIESWNKNKRKQFTIVLNLRKKQINSISIDDLHAFFLIDMSLLTNIRHLTQWINSKIKKILPILVKKHKNKTTSDMSQLKQSQDKSDPSKMPEICLKNIKISSRLEIQEQKLSISVSLPQLTKIMSQKQNKKKNRIENTQILMNKIQVNINQKNEGITITQVKLCQKVQKVQQNAFKLINRQHIVSIHSIFCSFDTCTLREIGAFFTFSYFYQFLHTIQNIRANIQSLSLICSSQVKNMATQIPFKIQEDILKQRQQIQQKESISIQQIQQIIKQEYNIYLRVNSLIISLGAYIKQYSKCNQKNQPNPTQRYNPIIMLQTQTIKAIIALKQKNERKANIKMSLKSLSCISPHNLSNGSILKYPVRVKLFHSTNYSNNDKNAARKEEKGSFGQDGLNGCNYGIEILDPIHIDLQQQYIYLLANLSKNIIPHHKPMVQKSQTFTTIKNLIKQQITLQYNNITSTSTISSNKSMTQNKNEQNIQFQNTNNVVFKQYCISPGSEHQIYLFDLCISILINGECSQPIVLALPNFQNKQEQIEPTLEMEMQKSVMEGSTKQKIGKSGQQAEAQEQKKQKQKNSNQNQTKLNPNLHDAKLQMQKAIIFPYHDECRYILQIDYRNGHLKLNIKYKYQLHLFEGVEQYCGLKMLEIRCIKFNKYEKFLADHDHDDEEFMEDVSIEQITHGQHKDIKQTDENKNIISMDWQLLEQDKLQHLSFLIQTSKIHEYKVHRLMTNSIKYKIYGLYPMTQKKQIESNKPLNEIYHYYILEEVVQNYTEENIQHADLNTHHYYLMPFLILINNLSNNNIKLNITNKKSSLAQEYQLKAQRYCVPFDNSFDYYMKQYMIRLQIQDNATRNQDIFIYQSEEHYFNTFFMVDQSFQNVIELRCTSSKANLNFNKRHIRMRESFIRKTKILQIQDCLNIQNKTDYNLHIQILAQTMGKMGNTFKNNSQVSQANNSMELSSHSQKDYPIKLKKNDKILISYVVNGNKQNSIQVPVSKLNQSNNKLLLSYNFCKLDHRNIHKNGHHHEKPNTLGNQQNTSQQKYYQILIKFQLKTFSHNTQNLSYNSSNLQSQLVFTPFLTFTNLCSRKRKLKMNNTVLQSCYQNMKSKKQDYSISLCLPSNTNKDYNNKYLAINTEQIYEDLLVNSRNWIMQGNNHYLKIQLLPLPHSKGKKNHQNTQQKPQSITHSIYLNQLITHKTLQFNKSVYSLIKNLKDDIIQLYFSDHLFNTNVPAKYFVFNNSTQHFFLMNSSETQYAKYLLFPNQYEDEGSNPNKKIQFKEQIQYQKSGFKKKGKILELQPKLQNYNKNSQVKSEKTETTQKQIKNTQIFDDFLGSKVHIEGNSKNPVSMMLNKDKHDIFLCDSEYHKLESLTVRKLEKLKIKQEKYQIENFTILDFQNQNYNKKSQALQTSPQYQFSTSTITLKLFSKRKNCGIINQIKSISMRHFQNDKTDILIQDISVSVALQMQQPQLKSNQNANQSTGGLNIGQSAPSQKSKLQFFQILRIPQQSYVLVEGKSYLDKLILVKNIYIKCKIIDLHVNKQLLIVLSYFGKVGKFLAELSKSTHDHTHKDAKMDIHQNKDLEYKQAKKIQKLVKQKILLIKSVYIHPINLCLAVQTNPSMDFSNMITLPEYTISNKVYRVSNISKQISNHYLANVIAKFPKLSFIYQNLRNPISMVKSILETRNILISNQKEQQRKKIAWAMSYVDLQKKYFGFNYIKFPQKRLIQFLGFNNRKSDPQLDRVSQILLQITLDYPQNVNNRQLFICVLKNVVASNITKLSQMVNIPISYYLTNKNVRVISPNLPGELVSLKQIQSAKVVRYNKKSAELVITFKRRGAFIKIVDQFIVCHNLMSSLNSVLM